MKNGTVWAVIDLLCVSRSIPKPKITAMSAQFLHGAVYGRWVYESVLKLAPTIFVLSWWDGKWFSFNKREYFLSKSFSRISHAISTSAYTWVIHEKFDFNFIKVYKALYIVCKLLALNLNLNLSAITNLWLERTNKHALIKAWSCKQGLNCYLRQLSHFRDDFNIKIKIFSCL